MWVKGPEPRGELLGGSGWLVGGRRGLEKEGSTQRNAERAWTASSLPALWRFSLSGLRIAFIARPLSLTADFYSVSLHKSARDILCTPARKIVRCAVLRCTSAGNFLISIPAREPSTDPRRLSLSSSR